MPRDSRAEVSYHAGPGHASRFAPLAGSRPGRGVLALAVVFLARLAGLAGLGAVAAMPGCTRLPAAAGAPAAAMGPARPLPATAPVAHDGETFTWSVSYRGLEGARARVAVGVAGPLVTVRAQAESAGLVATILTHSDEVVASFDLASGQPRTADTMTETVRRRVRVRATHRPDRPLADLEIEVSGAPPRRTVRRLPQDAPLYDVLGALAILRGLQLPVGERVYFYTLGGQRLWRTELTPRAPETLDTALGRLPVRRLDGESRRLTPTMAIDPKRPARQFSIWITDDERAIPVRITGATELGAVVATLTAYSQPLRLNQ